MCLFFSVVLELMIERLELDSIDIEPIFVAELFMGTSATKSEWENEKLPCSDDYTSVWSRAAQQFISRPNEFRPLLNGKSMMSAMESKQSQSGRWHRP